MGPTFPGAWGIEWRCHKILERRSPESVEQGQKVIREWIAEWAEQRLAEDVDEFINTHAQRLYREGGWELRYLPTHLVDDYRGTTHASISDITHLLENWPDSADLPDGYPTEYPSDLDALGEIFTSGYPYDDIAGFERATEAEIYAAVALETVEAIYQRITPKGLDQAPPRSTWSLDQVLKASEWAVEAMELVGLAERELWDQTRDKWRKDQRAKEELETRKRIRSEMAKAAADAKVASDPKQDAKTQARAYWTQHRQSYKTKADFARSMMDKFSALTNQKVIEGWTREWDRQSASTVASQPAD